MTNEPKPAPVADGWRPASEPPKPECNGVPYMAYDGGDSIIVHGDYTICPACDALPTPNPQAARIAELDAEVAELNGELNTTRAMADGERDRAYTLQQQLDAVRGHFERLSVEWTAERETVAELRRVIEAVREDWRAERAKVLDLEAGRDLAALAVSGLESRALAAEARVVRMLAECERVATDGEPDAMVRGGKQVAARYIAAAGKETADGKA